MAVFGVQCIDALRVVQTDDLGRVDRSGDRIVRSSRSEKYLVLDAEAPVHHVFVILREKKSRIDKTTLDHRNSMDFQNS